MAPHGSTTSTFEAKASATGPEPVATSPVTGPIMSGGCWGFPWRRPVLDHGGVQPSDADGPQPPRGQRWTVREGRTFSPTAATVVRSKDLGPVQIVQTRANLDGDDARAGYVDPGDAFVWAVTLRGSIVTRVADGVLSQPGDLRVAHMARVDGFSMTPDFQAVSIRMSRRALSLTSAEIDTIMLASFPARAGVPFLLGALATQAMKMEGDLGPASSGALAQSILDLTAGFADDFFSRRSAPEVVRSNLVSAARQHIREHATSPLTTPATVAAALQVSQRTLQKAFEREDTTVAAAILDVRLRHARALLEREAATGVSIDRVCVRAGFASASSFSRAYKGRFGLSPREWRRLHGIRQPAHLT